MDALTRREILLLARWRHRDRRYALSRKAPDQAAIEAVRWWRASEGADIASPYLVAAAWAWTPPRPRGSVR